MPSQSETSTRGNPSQTRSSNEMLECLRDIMDILDSLSDEEWQCLTQGMEYNQHQKIVTNVSVNSSIPTLTDEPRTDAAHAEKTEQTKGKRTFKAKHTSRSTADVEKRLTDDLKTPLSSERSPTDLSAVIYDNLENIIYEVKMGDARGYLQGSLRNNIIRIQHGERSIQSFG
ncbi:hypothetical protein SRHO_G00184390 [Serrasalmus rhombeus]